MHVTIFTCTRMQLQPQIAANLYKHTSDINILGKYMKVNTHSKTLMDPSDSRTSVEVMSVWALRLCQQVGFFCLFVFCSYLLFVDREHLLTYWDDVQSEYSLNSSPKPIRLPAACHSFLFPFPHTVHTVAAVHFLPFPTSLRILLLMPANISNPPDFIQTALFHCLSSRNMFGRRAAFMNLYLPALLFTSAQI